MWKSSGAVGCVAVALVAGLVWSAEAQQGTPGAGFAPAGRGELITHCLPGDAGKPATLTVIDPSARRIAVYQVNRDSGEIQLKSVRNIAWDLAMEYFNTGNPLPEEIRRGLERQQ